ncbi:MAG TPA: helix-turn-helix domain-containing protein, partial [Spirochaetota bacterium]|nr:helix-turn-helix domain-containing protein [Spirochaetota bacterium]
DDIREHLESDEHEVTPQRDISSFKKARERFEKEFIVEALRKNGKNISQTAQELGIERTNLHRKIKQYNINVDAI